MDQSQTTCSFPKILRPNDFIIHIDHSVGSRTGGRMSDLVYQPILGQNIARKNGQGRISLVSSQIGNDKKSSAKVLGKTTIGKSTSSFNVPKRLPVLYM